MYGIPHPNSWDMSTQHGKYVDSKSTTANLQHFRNVNGHAANLKCAPQVDFRAARG